MIQLMQVESSQLCCQLRSTFNSSKVGVENVDGRFSGKHQIYTIFMFVSFDQNARGGKLFILETKYPMFMELNFKHLDTPPAYEKLLYAIVLIVKYYEHQR